MQEQLASMERLVREQKEDIARVDGQLKQQMEQSQSQQVSVMRNELDAREAPRSFGGRSRRREPRAPSLDPERREPRATRQADYSHVPGARHRGWAGASGRDASPSQRRATAAASAARKDDGLGGAWRADAATKGPDVRIPITAEQVK